MTVLRIRPVSYTHLDVYKRQASAGAKFIAEKIDDVFAIALGYFEQTQDVQGIFSGRIIDVHKDTVMLVDGDIADREVVDHPGGVGTVSYTHLDVYKRQGRYRSFRRVR